MSKKMNNDSVAEQGRIQREHEVNMSLMTKYVRNDVQRINAKVGDEN